MHAIHTTPGLIIDSRSYGEADKMLSILTRDFGLVTVVAQGIRLERSKLRYFAQDRSFGLYSLVRGKELWRLTSAQPLEPGLSLAGSELFARVAMLLKRLLQGEDPNPDLYDEIEAAARFMATARFVTTSPHGSVAIPKGSGADAGGNDAPPTPMPTAHAQAFESVIVLRILDALGYIGDDPSLKGFLGSTPYSADMLGQAARSLKAINAHINKALKESHL